MQVNLSLGRLPGSLNQNATGPSCYCPRTLHPQSGPTRSADTHAVPDVVVHWAEPDNDTVGLIIRLESGDSASSTNHVSAGNLLVGVKLLSQDGSMSNCIARAHTTGDSLPEGIALRCGRRDVGGEESNTFTLRTDGSAVWESLYELPGGVDTTRRQRLGTFLYDASAGSVSMAFKELSGDDILIFAGTGDETAFQMTTAPDSGDGAQAAGQTCEYL